MSGEPIIPALGRQLGILLRSRGGQALLIALTITAGVCAFVPLADHLGFELAMALTIVTALVGPAAGIAAIRHERALPQDRRSPGTATIAAGLVGVLGLVVATGVILLNGLRRPTCDPLGGASWLLLLPIPTSFLATSLGALAMVLAKSLRGAVVRVVMIEVISLGWSLSTLYWGPAFFLFDHLFGYFPGPLYDEVVVVSPTVLVFRAMTLLWAAALIAAISAWGSTNSVSRWTRALGAALLVLGLLLVSWRWGTAIGFSSTDGAIASTLGGETNIDDLEIHYPREWSERTVEQFRRDAAFRAQQVTAELGISPKHKVRVWVYRDAEEKRRLVGASSTSFTKPWRHEVHINASAFPHPVLRHELVHAFAGEIAPGPFHVPGGLLPNSPLIEGFAVALEHENDGMTLMQWAKAMRDLKLTPDLTALLSMSGFFASAPSRAYSYAGAFIQYLRDRFGREKIVQLYASGDLRQLGDPLRLVADFEQHLDSVPISASEEAMAQRRFSRPSIFHRQCAREVSQITDEADDLLAAGRTQEALAGFERACSLEPDDPGLLRSLLTAEIRTKNQTAVDATAARLLGHPKVTPSLKAAVLIDLCDQAWRTGRTEQALRSCAEAAQLPVDPQTHRSAFAHVTALKDAALGPLLEPLFAESNADISELFRMNDYLTAHPDDALVAYLLGRQFVQRDAIARGLPLLGVARREGLGDDEMNRENLRLLARASAEAHECDAVAALAFLFPSEAHSDSDRQFVDDWLQRCRFETARGWQPLTAGVH